MVFDDIIQTLVQPMANGILIAGGRVTSPKKK